MALMNKGHHGIPTESYEVLGGCCEPDRREYLKDARASRQVV
jgi:hypothetical protein